MKPDPASGRPRLSPLLVRALPAIALGLGSLSSGCRSNTEEQPVPATSTPSLSWLTPARQERLADAVESLSLKHGWAAGCVFRWNADEPILDDIPRPAGEAGYSFAIDPELRPAILVYVEGAGRSGSYREQLASAAFCYVPD